MPHDPASQLALPKIGSPESAVQYTAIYVSGDLGPPRRVTTGHDDVESAKAAVDLWCREVGAAHGLSGEVLICQAREHMLREVLRRNLDGEWVGADPDQGSAGVSRIARPEL